MPSSVMRTPGGNAKMMVEKMPGTTPMEKNVTDGIRYTKAGIVCMKSMTGFTRALTVLLTAARMASGTAITTAKKVDTRTNAMNWNKVPHSPIDKTRQNPITV